MWPRIYRGFLSSIRIRCSVGLINTVLNTYRRYTRHTLFFVVDRVSHFSHVNYYLEVLAFMLVFSLFFFFDFVLNTFTKLLQIQRRKEVILNKTKPLYGLQYFVSTKKKTTTEVNVFTYVALFFFAQEICLNGKAFIMN